MSIPSKEFPVSHEGHTDTVLQTSLEVDEALDGGYGWICVACVFLINAHTWGLNSSYSVFLAYYLTNSTFLDATDLEFAFVGGLSISVALLVSPIATFVTRYYGTRTTLVVGVFFQTISLVGASFASQVWQLSLSQGLCFGVGMGFLFIGNVGVAPQWFNKRRGLANGICAGGSGIGGLIYSLATNAMIQHLGLAWAFRILAIVSFVVNFSCSILIRDRNKQIGVSQKMFDVKLFKRIEFLLMLAWGFFSMLGYVVLIFSLANYATSIGLNAKQGSVVAALLNLGQGLGRPVVGSLSDAFGRINMAGFLTFLCGLLCLVVWIFAKNYGVLIFFAITAGMVSGTFWATIGPVGAEVIGLTELPSAFSITFLLLAVPVTFSEPIALEMRTGGQDSYLHCQIFTGCMYLGAALCMWAVRTWKIHDLDATKIREAEKEKGERDERNARANLLTQTFTWRKV